MSSKVHRTNDGMEATPIVWRHAGGSAATYDPQLSSVGSKSTQETALDLQRDTQARIDAARQKAFAEGEAAGAQKAALKLQPAIAAFQAMTLDLASQSRVRRAEAEEDLVKLAIAIASRLVHRELATDPEAILGLVKAAAAKLNAREVRRLRLSPNYFTVIAAHRNALDLPPGLHIEPDESLGPDSVIFETTRGELDASVNTQLAEIDRGLTDIVRRKTRTVNHARD